MEVSLHIQYLNGLAFDGNIEMLNYFQCSILPEVCDVAHRLCEGVFVL